MLEEQEPDMDGIETEDDRYSDDEVLDQMFADDPKQDGKSGIEKEEREQWSFVGQIKKKPFEDFLKSISILNDIVVVNLTEEGIRSRVVNNENVSMVESQIGRESFDFYMIDPAGTEENRRFAIDLKKISSFIKNASKNEIIEIRYENQSAKITIKYGSFKYSTMAIDLSVCRDIKVPNISLTSKFEIDGRVLKQLVSSAKELDDVIVIESTTDDVVIRTRGEMGRMEYYVYPDQKVDPATAGFGIEYLEPVARVVGDRGDIKIEYGNDMPCRIISVNEEDHTSISYLIAPRIEEDL
jgi:proliferating cell nuclear antigen